MTDSPGPDLKPTARQAIATLAGGAVLATTTCAGFWLNLDVTRDSPVANTFIVLFLISLVVLFVGIVLVVVRQARLVAARRRASVDAGQAPPPSAAWQALMISIGLVVLAVGACGGMATFGGGDTVALTLLLIAGLAAVGATLFFLLAIVRAIFGR